MDDLTKEIYEELAMLVGGGVFLHHMEAAALEHAASFMVRKLKAGGISEAVIRGVFIEARPQAETGLAGEWRAEP